MERGKDIQRAVGKESELLSRSEELPFLQTLDAGEIEFGSISFSQPYFVHILGNGPKGEGFSATSRIAQNGWRSLNRNGDGMRRPSCNIVARGQTLLR